MLGILDPKLDPYSAALWIGIRIFTIKSKGKQHQTEHLCLTVGKGYGSGFKFRQFSHGGGPKNGESLKGEGGKPQRSQRTREGGGGYEH